MACLLLLPILGFPFPSEGTGNHVRPAGVVVAGLSAELGRPVEVAHPLKAIPVLVDEPGRSPTERLADLAFALRASVVRDGGTLRMERSAADDRLAVAAHRKALRGIIETGFAVREERVKRSATLGDVPTQVRLAQEAVTQTLHDASEAETMHRAYVAPPGLINPGSLTPAGRLTFDLARRMGSARLAELAPGEVRFFSDHPNAAESPLPPCADLVAAYERLQGPYEATAGTGDPDPPAKLLLQIDEEGLRLQMFDASGRRVARGGVDYKNRVIILSSSRIPLGQSGAVWRPLDEPSRRMATLLDPSPDDMMDALRRSNAAKAPLTPPPPPPALPEGFLYPERRDPLDFAVREGVLALPREPGTRGLVAVLGDGTLEMAHACLQDGRLDATAFGRGLFRQGDLGRDTFERIAYERIAHGTTTVLRPTDPLAAEAGLTDRAALGAAVRRVVADRAITLTNWPAVRLALYPSRDGRVTGRYLDALGLLGFRHYEIDGQGSNPTVLALLGALQASDRTTADGNEAPFRTILRDGLLHEWLGLKPAPELSDLAQTPSAILASGALDRARIARASAEAFVVGRASPGTPLGYGCAEPDRWGYGTICPPEVPRTERLTKALLASAVLRPRYREGRRVTLDLALSLGGLQSRLALWDSFLEKDDIAFEDLPPAFHDAMLRNFQRDLNNPRSPQAPPGIRVGVPPTTGKP